MVWSEEAGSSCSFTARLAICIAPIFRFPSRLAIPNLLSASSNQTSMDS